LIKFNRLRSAGRGAPQAKTARKKTRKTFDFIGAAKGLEMADN
jgi:hypothetical protein